MRKYIKPSSLTFWASLTPLSLGAFMAFAPIHGLTDWVYSIDALTGGVGPYGLVNAGLAGIGIRAAIQ